MDEAQYTMTQHQIVAVAAVIRKMDLAGFLNAIQRSETLAPILDPTLWRRGAAKLSLMKQTAEALLDAQRGLPDMEEWVDAQAEQEAVEAMLGRVL